MSPVERLQAAIEKLETLRGCAIPGRWTCDLDFRQRPVVVARFDNQWNGNTVVANLHHSVDDAELIVTLHRTIAAQLEVLHAAWSTIAGTEEMPEGRDPRVWYGRYAAAGLALADAILRGDR